MVGADLGSKQKVRAGLGDSRRMDLGESTEKEAGDKLEFGVAGSL